MFPGLVMMALVTNSFMNPGWSLYQARHFDWIEPILSSPMSSTQIVSAYILAGVIRGLLVSAILIVLALVIPSVVVISNPGFVILYLIIVSFLGSSLGTLIGLWADKFDHMALAQSFGLFPLVFLGGVFCPGSPGQDKPGNPHDKRTALRDDWCIGVTIIDRGVWPYSSCLCTVFAKRETV